MKRVVLFLAVLTVLIPGSSRAATTVGMGGPPGDWSFSPKTVTISVRGDAGDRRIVWDNTDEDGHNVGRNGVQGWMSPFLEPGDTYDRVFKFAGGYPYVCVIHGGMNGVVKVRPWAGSDGSSTVDVGESARVRVGAEAPPSNLVFDIQKRNGLGGEWEQWRRGVETASVSYTPPTSTNRWFRARLRRPSDGDTTNWSPPFELNVV